MKIKINKIVDNRYMVRDKLDEEHLAEIKDSLKQDGQWNPIIVKPDGNNYVIVSGHYRVQAAKELGWSEIDATVMDLSDESADFLSLKANIVRESMSEIEEAKVIKKVMDKYNLSQNEVAKRIGKKQQWISRRLSLILKVTKKVQEAFTRGVLSADHVNLISLLSEEKYENWEEKQNEFLDMILENKWSRDETRIQLKRYMNDTICTIGYMERNIDEFIKILKNNKIQLLIDIRFSAESQYKPEFNKKILQRYLENAKIKYEHHSEFGLPYPIQNAYKDGGLSTECTEQWYGWHIKKETEFEKFYNHIKDYGKTALMCMEKYAIASREQKIHCHRHFFAKLLLEDKGFENRVDL